MKYLITGRNGQLARAFIRIFEKRSIDLSAPDESRLDITNDSIVSEAVATSEFGTSRTWYNVEKKES